MALVTKKVYFQQRMQVICRYNNNAFPPLISYLHSATFEDGDLHHVYVYMYILQIGDGGPVIAIFIISMDLKMWQSGFIAGPRHQIAAVAHEVVIQFVKGGVMGITRRYACRCT